MEEQETTSGPSALEEAAPIVAPESTMTGWDTRMRSFEVRLMRFDRPQSKAITVRANSEARARAQAQARAGRDWRIARISAI